MIEWEDSRQPSAVWSRLAGFKPDGICKCISVGFLISDGKDYKALAPNMADIESEENLQVSGTIHIPARSITKITPLEETIPHRK